MIKIYYKDRYITISQEKIECNDSDFQAVAFSEIGELKIRINRFTTNNNLKHLNFYGVEPKRGLGFFKKTLVSIMAAGGLVYNNSNLWLFIHRNNKWDLPKGKAEKGEEPEICALREVSEECGIMLSELHLENSLGSTYHIYKQDGKFILKETFWYQMRFEGNPETLEPQYEEDIDKCVWVDDETIPQLMRNSYASIKDFLAR